jgi:hypothetical protein
MDHIPEEDWPAVGDAAHAVVREAKGAGVWIFGGGVQRQQSSIVAAGGAITDGPVPETKSVVGGFSIIEVPSPRRRSRGQPESPKRVAAPKRFARSCSTRSREGAVRRRSNPLVSLTLEVTRRADDMRTEDQAVCRRVRLLGIIDDTRKQLNSAFEE